MRVPGQHHMNTDLYRPRRPPSRATRQGETDHLRSPSLKPLRCPVVLPERSGRGLLDRGAERPEASRREGAAHLMQYGKKLIRFSQQEEYAMKFARLLV